MARARATAKHPGGRRPGDSGTRAAILEAARRQFAEHGYDGASLRAIAGAAGVDAALIRHFFGDKATLFATVLADTSTFPAVILDAFTSDEADIGSAVTRAYLGLWEDPTIRPTLEALLRSANTSSLAADMLASLIEGRVRTATGADDARIERIALAMAHLLGIAYGRYLLQVRPLASMSFDDLVRQAAPAIQRYLGPASSE